MVLLSDYKNFDAAPVTLNIDLTNYKYIFIELKWNEAGEYTNGIICRVDAVAYYEHWGNMPYPGEAPILFFKEIVVEKSKIQFKQTYQYAPISAQHSASKYASPGRVYGVL